VVEGRLPEALGSVCKVRTQEPENFDEEVKFLVSAWYLMSSSSNRLQAERT